MKSILNLSYLYDWYAFMPRHAHDLVAGRRGAPLDSLERLKGYAKLKLNLSLDASLDPPLRAELEKRLGRLAMNPLESGVEGAAPIAEEHYAWLRRYAEAPEGLPAMIERDRSAEVSAALHPAGERLLFRFGTIVTAGLYRHSEQIDPQSLALLDLR